MSLIEQGKHILVQKLADGTFERMISSVIVGSVSTSVKLNEFAQKTAKEYIDGYDTKK